MSGGTRRTGCRHGGDVIFGPYYLRAPSIRRSVGPQTQQSKASRLPVPAEGGEEARREARGWRRSYYVSSPSLSGVNLVNSSA